MQEMCYIPHPDIGLSNVTIHQMSIQYNNE